MKWGRQRREEVLGRVEWKICEDREQYGRRWLRKMDRKKWETEKKGGDLKLAGESEKEMGPKREEKRLDGGKLKSWRQEWNWRGVIVRGVSIRCCKTPLFCFQSQRRGCRGTQTLKTHWCISSSLVYLTTSLLRARSGLRWHYIPCILFVGTGVSRNRITTENNLVHKSFLPF